MNNRDGMTEREQWAEDHGYYHWRCRDCGQSGWTDTTPDCACRDDIAGSLVEPEEGEFRCDNCGEIFPDADKTMDEEFAYCHACWPEFRDA